MPSIEVICIDQEQPTTFAQLPFRVTAETTLVSHRKPHPLFQSDFDAAYGCIYHMCNPIGSSTAYYLLDMEAEFLGSTRELKGGSDVLQAVVFFRLEYVAAIRQMLQNLLEDSPAGRLIFTSDYQFGPSVRRYKTSITLDRFWELHDSQYLRMNALYHIRRSRTSNKK